MASHRATCKMDKETSKNETKSEVDSSGDQEITKLVTTPDIQCYEDMEGPENGSSKSPIPVAPPNLMHNLSKRGRKKQLHPQQVLTPERIKEVVNNNLIQCGLCEIVIPANDEAKHLQVTIPISSKP